MHLYCNVPQCKRCKSYRTGYFISGNVLTPDIVIKHLKKGEYVMVLPEISRNNFNCFCLNCGIQWQDYLSYSFVSNKRIQKEKIKREIDDSDENVERILYTFKKNNNIQELNKDNNDKKGLVKNLIDAIKW